MAEDNQYAYSQNATSREMAGAKEDDIRAQIAALRGNTNLASFATQRTGTRRVPTGEADQSTREETYDLSQQELEASGNIARQNQINAYQSKIDSGNLFNDQAQSDYYKGVKSGEAILGPKGLGRLSSDTEVQDVLSRYKKYADEGLGAEELAAQRQQMNQEINRGLQTSSRGLAGQLARSGVKGAIAGSQQGALYAGANAQRANVERDIFLRSADVKQQALQQYGRSLGDVKTFDLGQIAKEKNIILQSGMGFQQIGASERSATKQADASAQSAAASSGGGKIICTELFRQGLMPRKLYLRDQMYGKSLIYNDPELLLGYHMLAQPIVNIMEKNPLFTKFIIAPIVMPWAKYIGGQPNKIGAIIHYVGSNLCRFIYKSSRLQHVVISRK